MTPVLLGNKSAIIQSVTVHSSPRDFTRVSIELILPMFGIPSNINVGSIIDAEKLFAAPEVKAAIQEEIGRQTRVITLDRD